MEYQFVFAHSYIEDPVYHHLLVNFLDFQEIDLHLLTVFFVSSWMALVVLGYRGKELLHSCVIWHIVINYLDRTIEIYHKVKNFLVHFSVCHGKLYFA